MTNMDLYNEVDAAYKIFLSTLVGIRQKTDGHDAMKKVIESLADAAIDYKEDDHGMAKKLDHLSDPSPEYEREHGN